MAFSAADAAVLSPIPSGQTVQFTAGRRAVLGDLARMGNSDIGELAIAANATGLLPDVEELHGPVLRAAEIPEVLCPEEEGGMLKHRGVIEGVICLRHPSEAGLGGGVFIVVACGNDYSRHILTTKGLVPNSRGSAALIYRPYHLCGVETATSILCAGLLGVPTGATELLPRVDVAARVTEDLQAGERVGDDHSPSLRALMRSAQPVRDGAPLPLQMASGNLLTSDVPTGTLITAEMLVAPPDSTLWSLRAQQDRHFF